MLFFRKLFKLPSPIDLGWSEYNALEVEDFCDDPKGKTWEQWHQTVKKMHPVKYFFAETFADFVRYKIWFSIKNPFSKAHYWIVSHCVPSRRYHFLDLRQPNGYRYGWTDVPEKMLFAMFNLLGEYLNEEKPHDLTQWYTKEQIDTDEGLKRQQNKLEEARAIYHWWTVEREEEYARKSEMQNKWWTARKSKDPNREKYWEQLCQMDIDMEAKTDEMIGRLMKIRRSLWT